MSFKKTSETLIKGSHTLDQKYYLNQDILDQEYNNIFFKSWICAGRLSELENIGDFKMIEICNESVIIIRNKLKELSAYYNVCRHRGTKICTNSKGNYSKSIQCGYHGWTYNLDGSLIGAPNMDNVEGFSKSDYPLHKIKIAEWEGFILINLSDSSCIPIKYLVASSMAHFKIGQFEDGFEIYDLMIKLKKDKGKERLMEEIKHYLNLINK